MTEDIRIGHRGLERRDFDNSYWLNGTRIDHDVYNLELQRQIAWAAERQHARDTSLSLTELQRHQEQQIQAAQAQANQQRYKLDMLMCNSYRYRTPSISPQVHEALSVLNQAKPSQPNTAQKLSLKTTPLFSHLKWRFDSPFTPLRRALFRWAYRTSRGIA